MREYEHIYNESMLKKLMLNTLQRKRGFTIVELLIVIVIIGILAGLVITVFTGVQARARNSQMTAAVSAYKKALLAYQAGEGTFPAASSYYGACLGSGYQNDQCWIGTNGNYKVEPMFENAIKSYFNTRPKVPTTFYAETSVDRRSGIVYFDRIEVAEGTYGFAIEYFLEGTNADCVISDAVARNNTAGGKGTRCRIVLGNT